MRKVIRDPIHGYIEVDELAIEIIDTVEMQRLRRIKQLGFSYLVYPGANHTRFEHSLGTYHLMKAFLNKLDREGNRVEEWRELLIAALIHDVGHGPYSHVTEPLIRKYARKGHEDIEDIIFGREKGGVFEREKRGEGGEKRIVDVLEEYCMDKRKIIRYIKGGWEGGERSFSKILNSEIDIDKMDYLVRDSYYTGVAYGVVDYIRLLEGLDFFKDNLVITEKGVLPSEYLLFSRFLMYPTVYYHHTARIAQFMFSRALEYLIENSSFSPEEFALSLREMDDAEIDVVMRREGGYVGEMMRRINNRRLFKRALYKKVNELREEVVEELKDEGRVREIEEEVSKKVGIDARYVIVDVQIREEMEEGEAKVLVNDELRSLREVSAFVRMLGEAFKGNYKIGVYTLDRYREEVRRVVEEILC
ncbi:MAG: HD domain-containing protein [Candidatus Methanospirareceae archaeon]